MKKITVLLACLLLTSYSFGQMQVKWGPKFKKEGGMFSTFYVIDSDEDNYYLIMRTKKEAILLKYDYNHKLISETPLVFEHNGNEVSLNGFIQVKAKTFGIFSEYDKRGNKLTTQAAEFSSGKFEPFKEIAKQPNLITYKYQLIEAMGIINIELEYVDRDAKGGFVMSSDSSCVATIEKLSSKGNSGDQIGIFVFDENMELKWHKIQVLPFEKNEFSVKDFAVSNSGDVYLTAALNKEKKEKEEGTPNYNYKIIRISKDAYDDYDINLSGDNVISSAGFFASPNNEEVVIGGFTMDLNKDTDGNNGVFFGKLNVNSGEFKSQTFPFSIAFLEGLIDKENIDKGDGIEKFFIRNFITFSDGSFSFIAEQSYSKQSTPSLMEFCSNEILIPRFNSDGTLRNIAKIDKNLMVRFAAVISYSHAVYKDKLYLLYNKSVGAHTDLAVIGNNGEVESIETLFTRTETGGFYIPILSYQYGNKWLIVNDIAGSEYKMGVLELK